MTYLKTLRLSLRESLACLLTVLLCVAGLLLLGVPSHAQLPRKVFIIAGQSNAEGRGKAIQLAPVPVWAQTAANGWTGAPQVSSDAPNAGYPHPSITTAPCLWAYSNGGTVGSIPTQWTPYALSKLNSSGAVVDSDQYGPELSFIYRYMANHPGVSVAVVKCVLGGSAITDWLPDPSRPQNMATILSLMLDQAKQRLDASGETWEWAGMLWMQGESAAATAYPYLNPGLEPQYSTQLRQFLAGVRAQTRPNLPVVIGRIGNQMLADPVVDSFVVAGSVYQTRENVIGAINYRRALQVQVGSEANNGWTDTDNLPVNTADAPAYRYHFTGPGYLAMGERMYLTYSQIIGETPAPPPAPGRVDVSFAGILDPTKTATITVNGVAITVKPGDIITVNVVGK